MLWQTKKKTVYLPKNHNNSQINPLLITSNTYRQKSQYKSIGRYYYSIIYAQYLIPSKYIDIIYYIYKIVLQIYKNL